jgi:hypothetical protein
VTANLHALVSPRSHSSIANAVRFGECPRRIRAGAPDAKAQKRGKPEKPGREARSVRVYNELGSLLL